MKKRLSDAALSRGASSFIMIHGYSAEGLPAEPTALPSANEHSQLLLAVMHLVCRARAGGESASELLFAA